METNVESGNKGIQYFKNMIQFKLLEGDAVITIDISFNVAIRGNLNAKIESVFRYFCD